MCKHDLRLTLNEHFRRRTYHPCARTIGRNTLHRPARGVLAQKEETRVDMGLVEVAYARQFWVSGEAPLSNAALPNGYGPSGPRLGLRCAIENAIVEFDVVVEIDVVLPRFDRVM